MTLLHLPNASPQCRYSKAVLWHHGCLWFLWVIFEISSWTRPNLLYYACKNERITAKHDACVSMQKIVENSKINLRRGWYLSNLWPVGGCSSKRNSHSGIHLFLCVRLGGVIVAAIWLNCQTISAALSQWYRCWCRWNFVCSSVVNELLGP